ncbi:NOL1/NOP2/sun family putative RNA methylase [Nanoarchaeota archaeon]
MSKEIFLKRYKELGEDPDFNIKVKQSIRVNALKISDEELVERLIKKVKLEKIKWLGNGYYSISKFSLASTNEYLQGYFYIQDAVAQIPVGVLNPKPIDTVLDMAAAPGGKTTQISSLMKNHGVVVAVDRDDRRLEALQNNIERLGCGNVIVYKKDARYIEDLGYKFDKVLLDAPCSGNFLSEKNWFAKRNIEDIKSRAKLQKKMIEAGINVLKKNGILVYSTCSLEPEENEEVVDYALKFGVELIDTGLDVGDSGLVEVFGKKLDDSVVKCRRFWPWKMGTQGFFVAKIKKL